MERTRYPQPGLGFAGDANQERQSPHYPSQRPPLEIINELPRCARAEGKPDYLFSFTGNDAVNGFGYAKERLDKLMPGAEPWRIHDLRRTATTGMARLGIPPHVADRVLNHRSGTLSQVALVYNRFSYLEDRRDALEKCGRFVQSLVRPETSNVVALASR